MYGKLLLNSKPQARYFDGVPKIQSTVYTDKKIQGKNLRTVRKWKTVAETARDCRTITDLEKLFTTF